MSRFELPLETRRLLCGAGFHDVDGALRAAAVELESWIRLDELHMRAWSDGSFRHYTNFLAWSETTAGGINKATKGTKNQALLARWRDLWDEPLRQQFHELRNRALKAREDVASWRVDYEEGEFTLYRGFDEQWPGDVASESTEYLCWLRDAALPLLIEAIELGAHGTTEVEPELRLADQMAFPDTDPWMAASDPEIAALADSELERET